MGTVRPAIQLYSVRGIDESLPAILRRVAEVGFEGVEFGNRVHDADVDAVAAALSETGLHPVGAHVSLREIENETHSILERLDALGCKHLVIPHISPSSLRTESRLHELGARLNCAAERVARDGFTLSYHTQLHDFTTAIDGPVAQSLLDASFVPPRGEYVFEAVYDRARTALGDPPLTQTKLGLLAAATEPGLQFQIDIGWVVAAGYELSSFPSVELRVFSLLESWVKTV